MLLLIQVLVKYFNAAYAQNISRLFLETSRGQELIQITAYPGFPNQRPNF